MWWYGMVVIKFVFLNREIELNFKVNNLFWWGENMDSVYVESIILYYLWCVVG